MISLLGQKTPLLAKILSVYITCVEKGYPEDTSFYTLKASPQTMENVCRYFSVGAFIPPAVANQSKKELIITGNTSYIFVLEEVNSMPKGKIEFGPVPSSFFWKGI